MCGIGGYVTRNPGLHDLASRFLCESMSDRGPDDFGVETLKIDGNTELKLIQTRLSIIDLSHAGHQPFRYADGDVLLSFNGEIYNYIELRQELINEGYEFESSSDTEVLAASWHLWGEEMLERLDGMFAFAIWDKRINSLILARDAFGVKPLYWSHQDGVLAFASTPAALINSGLAKSEPSQQAMFNYIAWGQYDLGDQTFFESIRRIEPATILKADLSGEEWKISSRRWWNPSLKEIADVSLEEASENVRRLFLQSVERQMRSDAPLAFALSGGVDSSSIVCAARFLFPNANLMAFSYIPDDPKISEIDWINKVQAHTNAEIVEVKFSLDEMNDSLEEMAFAQGEPFSSSRIYAQYKVFEAAQKRGFKVVLEGQGADEILAGYQGFAHLRVLSMLEKGDFISLFRFLRAWRAWPGRSFRALIGQSVSYVVRSNRFSASLQSKLRDLILSESTNQLLKFERLKGTRISGRQAHLHTLKRQNRGRRVIEGLYDAVQNSYIPQLVRQGDRNAMHHSIENRVPFLSIPLVEYLFRLPESFLISDTGETKSVFRLAMRGIVPDEVLNRRDKVGFETPQDELWKSPVLLSAPNAAYGLSGSEDLIARVDPASIRGVALKWRYLNLALWLNGLRRTRT